MSDQLALLQKHFDTAIESPDGIKKLRELILTLAMQGKMVKQDPKDQPASELLKEIQAEKEQMTKEGKLKKQKELPPIKPEEVPYEVPEGWEWVRLGYITSYNGRDNAKPNDINDNTWVLDLEDIEKDTSRVLYRAKYSERQSKSNKSLFQKGDVLYGKLRPYLNKVIVADSSGVCTTEIVPIVPTNIIRSDYLLWLLKRPAFISHVNALSYGVKMPRLGTDDAVNSLHPLPPLAEQKRIVAKIDELMALCTKLEAQRNARNDKRLAVHTSAINRLLTAPDANDFDSAWQFITRHFDPLYSVKVNVVELKKAILTLAMQGKLVKQDPKDQPASELLKEIQAEKERLIKEGRIKIQKELPPIKPEEVPYEVPEGWVWVRFGEIAQHNSGKTLDSGRNRGVPRDYITTSNLYWGRFVLDSVRQMLIQDEELEKCTAKHGDLLICEGGEAGRAAVWMLDYDVCFQNHVHRARFFKDVEPFFSYRFFEKINATGEINQHRKGVGISNMSSKTLSNILFPLPPLAEQKRIVAKIDELMALCDKLEKQIEQATAMQTALFDAVLAKV